MINDATSNFKFKNLEGSDEAGYNTINELITDIDNELYARVAVPGMVMLYDTTAPSANVATLATKGWINLGVNPGAPLTDLTGSDYVWIMKDET